MSIKKIVASVLLYFLLFFTAPTYGEVAVYAAKQHGRPMTLWAFKGHLRMAAYAYTGASMFAPVTHYYRLHGGAITNPDFPTNRCNGTADVDDPGGAGTNINCAADNPMRFIGFFGGWITGANGINMGDTIANTDGATFYIGEQLPGGPGTNWTGLIQNCGGGGYTPNCILPSALDGMSFTGSCSAPCHSTNGLNLNPTTTWAGVNGAFWMLDVSNTSDVTVRGLRITSAGSCTLAAITAQCNRGVDNYAQHGLNFNYQNTKGPTRLTILDVQVDNMAGQGVLGAYFNTSISDTTTISYLLLKANAFAGFDWDGGNCANDTCGSVGAVVVTNPVVDWSGCNLAVPMDTFDSNGFAVHGVTNCATQSNNGYGDGFAVGVCEGTPTVGFTLSVLGGHFRYNLQDGFDPLHEGDCPTTNPSTIVIGNENIGNGGQAYKLGAGNSQTLIANFGDANCRVVVDHTVYPMTHNPAGYDTFINNSGDLCRGNDILALVLKNGATYDVEDNTILGYAGVGVDIACYAGASPSTNCVTGTTIIFRNNLFIAYADPNNGTFAAGIFFNGISSIFGTGSSHIDHNGWFNARNGCPQDAAETNTQCGNPLLVNQSVNTPDIHLTSTSPDRGAGVNSSVTTDYFNQLYLISPPTPRSIGAAEFIPSGGTVATPSASPAAGTFVTSVVVSLTDTTGGATICWKAGSTLAATTPGTCDAGSTIYTGAISLTTTTTLFYIGTLVGSTNSSAGSGTYTITTPPPPPSSTVQFNGVVGGMARINH